MAANENKNDRRSGSDRRDFARRQTTLTARLSSTPDFTESWPVSIKDISLTGMHLLGNLPDLGMSRIYIRIDGTESRVVCEVVTQNRNGIRVKVELDNLELTRLLQESDVYAALVLESMPDTLFPR